jgi:hypothetical protein
MAAFVSGEVLTAANLNNAINAPTLNAQSASAYTLALTDAGKIVQVTASVAASVEIPAESSVNFVTGTAVAVLAYGSASVDVVAASGVTLNSTAGSGSPVAVNGQYAGVQLYKVGSDEWLAVGAIQ